MPWAVHQASRVPVLPVARPGCAPIRPRSNSARAPKTWSTSLPPLVMVSILSWRDLKPMPPLLQEGDGVDEVSEGAAEPVEPPDDEGVAAAQMRERLGEAGPLW